jgi:hypothetical protein
MPGTKIRREITVGNPTCLLSFSGRDSVDSAVFDSSTLQPGGIDEVQTLSITGPPPEARSRCPSTGRRRRPSPTTRRRLRSRPRCGRSRAWARGSCRRRSAAGDPVTITFTGAKLGKKDQPLITVASRPHGRHRASGLGRRDHEGRLEVRQPLRDPLSGLPLMRNGGGDKVVEWDGASAATLVGIFDGQRRAAWSGGLPGHPRLQPRVRVRQGRGQELRHVHGQLQHLGCGTRLPVQVPGLLGRRCSR